VAGGADHHHHHRRGQHSRGSEPNASCGTEHEWQCEHHREDLAREGEKCERQQQATAISDNGGGVAEKLP
jgi:hypothetical protein